MGIIKFGTKVGILGGAIYYSKEIGVWEDSSKTYELSKNATAFVKPYLQPYVETFKNEVPTPLKELPSADDICRSMSNGWNKGVIVSISFLINLPKTISCYGSKGIAYLQNELQKGQTSQSKSPN